MFNYFGVSRRLAKSLRDALSERDQWKARALVLETKLDKRSDFFIEREMKLVDRFLTSQVKTFAITDEIKAQEVTAKDIHDAGLDDFMADKKEALLRWAKEANIPDPEIVAERDFTANYDRFRLEYEAQ
jgi:hypothetical protein